MQLNKNLHAISTHVQSGMTLIEVLVSVLVLSLGLLGVAGMQTSSIRSNHSAYLRSQASIAAHDIIDRMRSNPSGVQNGAYNAIDTTVVPASPACVDTSGGCSAANLAINDIREWSLGSVAPLPQGSATVTVDDMGTAADPSDDVFVVTVNWQDLAAQDPDSALSIKVRL